LHRSLGRLWRLKLDLRALAESCSDRPVLVGFLQRRREPAPRPPPGADAAKRSPDGPKALTISVVRTILQEREPLADLGRVFDVLCAACANVATAAASPAPGASKAQSDDAAARLKGIPPGSPAVTAEEMLTELFAPLAEEAGIDSLYLRAALVEYLRAADAAGVPVPAALPALLVRARVDVVRASYQAQRLTCPARVADGACGAGRAAGARQLRTPAPDVVAAASAIRCGARTLWTLRVAVPATRAVPHTSAPLRLCALQSRAQPSAASAAQSLVLAADAAGLDGVRQMAVDAQRRAHAHDTLVREMLLAGQVLQALRYVRRNRVESVPPAVFMEAAAAQDDPPVYASTYRFCSEYVPGFRDLPDHAYYSHRLSGST
jgi:hypothetical protein